MASERDPKPTGHGGDEQIVTPHIDIINEVVDSHANGGVAGMPIETIGVVLPIAYQFLVC